MKPLKIQSIDLAVTKKVSIRVGTGTPPDAIFVIKGCVNIRDMFSVCSDTIIQLYCNRNDCERRMCIKKNDKEQALIEIR
jgi:hypothetical protein